jgi:GNAT superfamily N-acetyltransferase
VLDAAIVMEWRPDGASEVLTDGYRLIRYPDWALDPSFPAAQVTRSRLSRPADAVIDEVLAHVRQWGLLGVAWWVSDATWPADTEDRLRARGGKRIDAVQILACDLRDGLPELGIPAGVTVELVRDERTFRAASMVTVRGWGRKEPSEQDIARDLTDAIRDLAAWSGFRVVASVDGEPASSGGCTLNGEVAQLWGAVTLPAFRRRGSYRAVLAERLRLARDHGTELALVKGRVETSGPILLRAGFTDYGEERCYWLSRLEPATPSCAGPRARALMHPWLSCGPNPRTSAPWARSSARCSGCPPRSSTTPTGSGPIPAGSRSAAIRRPRRRWSRS